MVKNNKGFTLIELLVVIAIIGILASVVLASLSTARARGKDAAIKAAVSSAMTQGEIASNGTGYNTLASCGSTTAGVATSLAPSGTAVTGLDATLANIAINVYKNGGALYCTGSTTNIAFYSVLVTTTSDSQCVDNNGFAGTLGAPAPTALNIAASKCK